MSPPVIVVGIDGSEGGDRALATAVEVAAAAHYGVVAVHVAHVPAVLAATAVGAAALGPPPTKSPTTATWPAK